ncbi:hypothetical protein [Cellulomonas chengniuliangii]|uniref:Scramblase n=1 Tax=Cellulomonas chengniuliangii TaxID=2968084 RepID=A0ABY5KYW0_9CELL|nr:hypothetical protein [Cellulomonas chengniuliangii]MCC2307527.1 hypothetical protein [Cellulomonas chengniuliangii]MCC2318638.1 hypothetical protein [Cellulomonas chengniuliangii]UUI75702.1 hypothetical protein NP064_01915 [Cellulomonas chengniuliangii]
MTADVQDLVRIERFAVEQKITMMVNRYEIRALDADGNPGAVLGVAQQKRMAFKEQVTFYTDESRQTPVFGFKARQRMDLAATYDVTDAQGSPIGSFRKDFGKSLLRSTWHLDANGVSAVGQERSQGVAIGRRVWEMLPVISEIPAPFVFHFDFRDASGELVMSSVRRRSLRDRYIVEVPAGRLDGRVAAAMAVALDALQSR